MIRTNPVSSLLLVVLASACSNPTPPPQPAAFDRPESVSFFCWDRVNGVVVDLSVCTAMGDADAEDDLGRPPENYELHAVVAQTGTGEIAAVQVTGDDEDNPPRIIDSDVRVPGFTFVPVGEVPAAVVTPRRSPNYTYVVSRGSNTVHVIETRSFRAGLGATVVELDVGLPPDSRPSAMALTPSEDALIVALPESGQVARVAIDGANLGTAQLLDLSTTIPLPVRLTAAVPDYLYTCNAGELLSPGLPAPREPVTIGERPRPWAVEIDAVTNQALIADRAFPLIHVLDLESFAEVAPLSVSVPTRALAITPYVPGTVDTNVPTERYLYAIDEIDRSVLVVDISDPARASFGAVLPVNVATPQDRLDLPTPARVLEVVTPAYADNQSNTFCTDAAQSSPSELHGVFLTVGTLDGRIRFFDIYDLDTTCRGDGCSQTTADGSDDIVTIRRHRPRIGEFVTEPVQVTPTPIWESASARSIALESDGTTDAPELLPRLIPLDDAACSAGRGRVFPLGSADTRLICAVSDPWAASAQTFTASYEGALPSTATTGGNFAEDEPVLEARADYCAFGVLGAENAPAQGDLAGYEGDMVAITGALPPVVQDSDDADLRARCEALVGSSTLTDARTILLPILSVSTAEPGSAATYTGRLTVGDPLNRPGTSLAAVRECFSELVQFEIRVRRAFVVTSDRTGFRHPVVRGADGRCAVDPELENAGQRGRAFSGRPYVSPDLAIHLESPPVQFERPVLAITIGEVPGPLTIDLSSSQATQRPSLLTGLTYNDVDQRLYALEQSLQGLVRIRLTDIAVQSSFQ